MSLPEEFPHLPKAPIVEAIIDLRARATPPWEPGTVRERLTAALESYSEALELVEQRFEFTPSVPPRATASQSASRGVMLRSSDERQIVQLRHDGFSFSRLAPYEQWETFVAEALRLWGIHCELLQPEDVQRVSVRFVNRILLPLGSDFGDFFQVEIAKVPAPSWTLQGFLRQHSWLLPDAVTSANVVLTNHIPEGMPPQLPVILDIEAVQHATIAVQEDLSARLAHLRDTKNRVFFSTLTPKAVDLLR